MRMSSISIVAVGAFVIAALAGLLRYLLKRPLNMASTREELLELFEDRCTLFEEHAPSTSRNDGSRVHEDSRASAAGNPTSLSASPAMPATSAETSAGDRREPARRSILGAAGGAMAILRAWRPYVARRAGLAQDRLAGVRASHLHRPQLGAYEKARVEHYQNEIHVE